MTCFQPNPKNAGGASLILAGGRESLQNQFALGGVHGRSDRKADSSESGVRSRGRATEISGEVLACHSSAVRSDSSALQRVPQFANVARPGIRLEEIHHVGAHAGHFLMMLGGYIGQQMLDE